MILMTTTMKFDGTLSGLMDTLATIAATAPEHASAILMNGENGNALNTVTIEEKTLTDNSLVYDVSITSA